MFEIPNLSRTFLFSGVLCAAVLLAAAPYPQQQPPPESAQHGAQMPPQQLDDVVAPIALYPDPLLGEVLAASTYPMELAEADQWVRDHPNWKPDKLLKEAKKQNWDPSVQALVAFPEVVHYLAGNIAWTTQLGNAFLAQQSDVMQAVQRMRAKAEARGTLKSTTQETVTNQDQGGQPVIAIEPANPDMWYVPNYNPAYIWGSPDWGMYPALAYPGIGFGLGWYPGIDIGLDFGGWGGWGWGGWGWAPDWYGHRLFVDHSFFHRYGFRGYGGEPLGRGEWAHNPEHRLGVPYANGAVAGRFGREGGFGGAERFGGENFHQAAPQQRFNTPAFEQRGWTGNHSVFGGYHNGGMTRMQSDHGFRSMGGGGFHGGGGRR